MIKNETLHEADKIINGERQDQYGSPEDSFYKISMYWTVYLSNKFEAATEITEKDVALLMTLFKIARMQGQGFKRDNCIDACGYLAIYNDRLNGEEPHPSQDDWEGDEIVYATPPQYGEEE